MSGPRYEPVAAWGGDLPDIRTKDVSDIAVGPNDEVYLLYREPSFVLVCGPDGAIRRTLGRDVLGKHAHGVTAVAGRTYVVDELEHCVRALDGEGREVLRFGDGPSDPSFPSSGVHLDRITKGRPPFTRPTRIAVSPWGELYVTDGYGNSRVHRFDPQGRLLGSWGEPGIAPGCFHIPHDVCVDSEGRVIVCDRENDRIQLFDREGVPAGQWTDLRRPQGVVQGADGLYYVAEGAWRKGQVSPVHGPVPTAPSRVSILDREGRPLVRIGTDRPDEPGSFIGAHGIAVDSKGDIYVAEVSASLLARFPELAAPSRTAVQKLRRVA
ncbi:MAG: hypothetical protein KGJ98_00265 [Chloroflexota bacterium]|nr:hypothetical protein [Chloroflexota bacterium]MDE3100647.1 hypothetical protein [Chloroflexota bacterium]